MAAQKTYKYATDRGIPGGIYDMYHYQVDSRNNEENDGKLGFGMGVIRGSVPGSNVKLPVTESTELVFEGITVNGFTTQQDLEGNTRVLKNQTVGVMKRGRIWVRIPEGVEPSYGDQLCLIKTGEDVGCFTNDITGTMQLGGRFIGGASNGVAPVELI